MTATITSPAPGRWRYAAGLLKLAGWLITHPSAPLPEGALNIPVPPGERGARLLALRDIADQYGVTEAERDGTIVAERRFGPVPVRAHLVARDHTRQLAMAGVIRKGGTGANPALLSDEVFQGVYGWAGSSIPGGAA